MLAWRGTGGQAEGGYDRNTLNSCMLIVIKDDKNINKGSSQATPDLIVVFPKGTTYLQHKTTAEAGPGPRLNQHWLNPHQTLQGLASHCRYPTYRLPSKVGPSITYLLWILAHEQGSLWLNWEHFWVQFYPASSRCTGEDRIGILCSWAKGSKAQIPKLHITVPNPDGAGFRTLAPICHTWAA